MLNLIKQIIIKKVILSATCFAFAAMAFMSCEKEEVTAKNPSTSKNEQVIDEDFNEKSGNNDFVNPYEFVGEIHNAGLHEVLIQENYESMSIQERSSVLSSKILNEFSNRGMNPNSANFNLSEELINSVNNISYDNILWEEMLIDATKQEKAVINNLKNEFKNFNNHANKGLTIANIKQLEKSTNNNGSFSSDEKVFLLSFIALSRNTFSYWRDKYQAEGEEFNGDRTPYASDIAGFVHGWRRARKAGGTLEQAYEMGVYDAGNYSARP